MKKKFLSYAMAASMVLTTIPGPVLAAEGEPGEVQEKGDEEQQKESDETGKDEAGKDEAGKDETGKDEAGKDEAGKDEQSGDAQGDEAELIVMIEGGALDADEQTNDDLFAKYALMQYFGVVDENDPATLADHGKDRLKGSSLTLYNALADWVQKVADGTVTSTTFTLSDFSWTKAELGLADDCTVDQASTAAMAEIKRIVTGYLLPDHPYDMYWFDKTKGYLASGATLSGDKVSYPTFQLQFAVDSGYADTTKQPYEYKDPKTQDVLWSNYVHTGSAQITKAKDAAANAKKIADQYKGETDIEKRLTSYKTAICSAVTYNEDAIQTGYSGGIDPWQLIYVFDNDDTTNVVCEGYAKAFQYLCDLSGFEGCYTVTGTTNAGNGAGRHMWNVVEMDDGRTLIADITNSDSGSIGKNGELFLKAVASEDGGKKHVFSINGTDMTYTYDEDMQDLYCDGYLKLNGTATVTSTKIAIPTAVTNLTYNGTVQTGVAAGEGYTLSGETQAINAKDNYTATAKLADKKNTTWADGSIDDQTITWSIAKKTPDANDFDYPTVNDRDYNGSPVVVPKPTLKSGLSGAGEITVEYSGDATPPIDARTYKVTFNVAEGENFEAANDLYISDLTIRQIDHTGAEKSGSTSVLSGQKDVTFTLPNNLLTDGAYYGTPTVGGTIPALIAGIPTVSGNTLTFSTTNQPANVSATIMIPVVGSKNYKDYDYVLTVTTKAKNPANVTLEGNLPDVTYGETFTVTAKAENAESSGGTWKWTTSDPASLQIEGKDDQPTVTVKALKAGANIAELKATYVSDSTEGSWSTKISVKTKDIQVENIKVKDKEYDGRTDATLDVSGAQINGKLSSDTLSVDTSRATATFENADAGTDKTVTVTGLQLTGTNAENYNVTSWGGPFTGTITKKAHANITIKKPVKVNSEGQTVVVDLSEQMKDLTDPSISEVKKTDGDDIIQSPGKEGKVVDFAVEGTATSGQKATVTATITSKNHADFKVAIEVEMTDRNVVEPKITGMPTSSIAYDDSFTLTAAATGANGTDRWKWTCTPAGVFEITPDEGSATVKVKALKPGTATITASYDSASAVGNASTATMTVAKRVITVKPVDKSMTVGDKLPEFTVSYSNFAEGDTADMVLNTASVKAEVAAGGDGTKVGSFTINVTVAPTFQSGMENNYELKTVDGKLTVQAKPSSGGGSSSGGSPGGSGGGSGSSKPSTTPGTTTNTTTNPDGSTTKTETKSDGTTIKTTTETDGTTTVTETKPDGTVTETVNNADGSSVKSETQSDGGSTTERKEADGSTSVTKIDANGNTEIEAKLSEKAIENAKEGGSAAVIPVDEIRAGASSNEAPTVKIELPSSVNETKVEIPVRNVTNGTVAVIVHPDGTEEIIKNSRPTEGGVQIDVNGDVTIKIIDNSKDFIDARDHWSRESVNFVAARDIFSGVGDGKFGVNDAMTRGMVNTVLARLAGVDTAGGATWYEKGTEWAKEVGISDGTNPTGMVTREQLATILYRYAGSPTTSGSLDIFLDSGRVSGYATDAMRWAVEQGILSGMGDGTLDPQGNATRAQVAAMLMRHMNAMS